MNKTYLEKIEEAIEENERKETRKWTPWLVLVLLTVFIIPMLSGCWIGDRDPCKDPNWRDHVISAVTIG